MSRTGLLTRADLRTTSGLRAGREGGRAQEGGVGEGESALADPHAHTAAATTAVCSVCATRVH
eukprot:3935232-Rhodomonas_salina.1